MKSIFIILILPFVAFAQNKTNSYVGVFGGFNVLNQTGKGFQTGKFIETGVWIGRSKPIDNHFWTSLAIGYSYSNIDNYKSKTSLYTNWDNGPETTLVNVETDIAQHAIILPFTVDYKIKRLTIGAGIITRVLLKSTLNQQAIGVYSIEGYQAGAENQFTPRVRNIYQLTNYRETAPFNTINLSTIVKMSYSLTQKLEIGLLVGYYWLKENSYKFKSNSYSVQNNSLFINLKL